LRTPSAHDYHCSLLSGPLADTDSVTYGINYSSTLNNLAHFHVANNQLPQDIMHILLEGVLPYTLKLMLNSFISTKKYFSIDFLNDRITCFTFSRSEARDKPCPLLARNLQPDGKLHQEGDNKFIIL
jgi:hypothetical protein